MKTDFIKYACMALVAGFLVTGIPGQGYAIDLSDSSNLNFIDALLVGSTGVHVCGDKKGTACSEEGETIKCKSKKGVKLCQTCTCTGTGDDKTCTWGSGAVGDCWNESTASTSEVDATSEKSVLGRF